MTVPSHALADLVVTDERGVAVIRLNRPHKLNALTRDMLIDLAASVRTAASGGARGIVVTGTGRAFSAGEDLAGVDTNQESLDDIELFQDITVAVLESTVPVVAALNGIAVGGAAEMTLSCDARLGSPQCEYFFPENGIGLTISNGSSRLLPRLIGGSRAMRIVLDARRLNAAEALEVGLVDELVAEGDDVVSHAVDLVLRWTALGRSTAEHLMLLRPSLHELNDALDRERSAAAAAWRRGASAAGVTAFRTRQRDK
jgi:enoyl-CoA hydratase/carnithine racemase